MATVVGVSSAGDDGVDGTVAKPTGTATGNWIYALVWSDETVGVSVSLVDPAGIETWTAVGSPNVVSGRGTGRVMRRKAVASEPATWNVDTSVYSSWTVHLIALSGIPDGATPFVSWATNASNASVNAPSVLSTDYTGSDPFIITGHYALTEGTARTWTSSTPTGMTTRGPAVQPTPGRWITSWLGALQLSGKVATTARTATLSGAEPYIAVTIALATTGVGGPVALDGKATAAAAVTGALARRRPASTVIDRFDDGTLDARWTPYGTGTPTESGGAAVLVPPLASTWHGIEWSDATLAMTEAAASVQVVDPGGLGDGTFSLGAIALYDTTDYNAFVRLYLEREAGGIYCGFTIWADASTQIASVVGILLDQSTRWIRIRETGGQIYPEVSVDGVTWGQAFVTASWATLAALQRQTLGLDLEVLRDVGAVAGDPVRFDNLNAPPSIVTLAGVVPAASAVVGALSRSRPLDGTAGAAAAVTGELGRARALDGASSASSAVTGEAAIARGVAGISSAAAAVTGAASVVRDLAGASSAADGATGQLGTDRPLTGSAGAAGAVGGTVAVARGLTGSASSSSTASGELTVSAAVELEGAAVAASAAVGELGVSRPLEGTAGAAGAVTGQLGAGRVLEGAVAAASGVAGELEVEGAPVATGAVRFSESTDMLQRVGALPAVSVAGITVTLWARMHDNRGYYSCITRVDVGGGLLSLETDADGATLWSFGSGGSVNSGVTLALDTWYRIAMTIDTTGAAALYVAEDADGPTQVATGTTGTGTPASISVGGRPDQATEWAPVDVACERFWSGVLDQSEVETEWTSLEAVRTSGLLLDWPLQSADDLTDHSGNGRHLTAGSTPVETVDGPPIGGAPGPVIVELEGVVAASSGVGGALDRVGLLEGAASAASQAVAALGLTRALDGAASSSTAAVGALGRGRSIEGSAHGASAGDGTLGVDRLIAGTAPAAAHVSGSVAIARPLEGGVSAASDLVGELTVSAPSGLDGSAAAASGAVGALTVTRSLAGTVPAAAGTSGLIAAARALTGVVPAAAAVTGDWTSPTLLEGGAGASSAAAGELVVTRGLAGVVPGAGLALGGALEVVRGLAGIIAGGASTAAGRLDAARQLAGLIAASSAGRGTLSVRSVEYPLQPGELVYLGQYYGAGALVDLAERLIGGELEVSGPGIVGGELVPL